MNESMFPIQDYSIENTPHTPALALNEVFKASMKKAQEEVKNLQVIVRCESLPQIEGSYQQMLMLFDHLLSIIIKHPPKNSRLFLYVDCEEETNDCDNEKRFFIKFNTNAAVPENWKVMNSQAFIICRQILSNHNGTLIVNNISSTGCLFIVSLPGKTE